MRAAHALLLFLIGSWSGHAAVELGGWMIVGDLPLVVIRDTATKKSSPWLKVGEAWRDHRVVRQEGRIAIAPDDQGPQQRLISVRARPQTGFASKAYETLVLATPRATYRLPWSPGTLHHRPVLEPGHIYDFVLIERSHPRRYGARVWHQVWQVGLEGRLLYDGGTCEVHDENLTSKAVPVIVGCGRPDFALVEARNRFFPHANRGFVYGGEAFGDEVPTQTILVCARCDLARREWKPDRSSPTTGVPGATR